MKTPTRRRILFATLLAATGALFATTLHAQKAIFVVRHGEKISEEDERLTEAGRARAGRLAAMLKTSGVSAVYSTDTERTIGTAQPLADSLGLKIRIYAAKPVDGGFDFKSFVESLRSDVPAGIALVVGHSNSVPPLLRALGCAEDVSIANDEYDNLFVVVPRGTGSPTLLRLRY